MSSLNKSEGRIKEADGYFRGLLKNKLDFHYKIDLHVGYT